ncbi:MAG: hypothetical protein FJ128_11330 [Deltaproteobacteria bacterium]|nr:hypothetical protein [Deltaproteobacteria bacterium]
MAVRTRTQQSGKRVLYFEEAESLYLAGKGLEEIRELLPIAAKTLKQWHREGKWEEKKRQALVSPRWLGKALKGILREKTGRLLARGELKPAELEELTRIITLIEKLCYQGWDLRAAALEVMDRFSEFLRGWVKDPEEIRRFSQWMQEFFRKLEDEEQGGRD